MRAFDGWRDADKSNIHKPNGVGTKAECDKAIEEMEKFGMPEELFYTLYPFNEETQTSS